MKLYEIVKEIEEIFLALEETESENAQEFLKNKLAESQLDFADKIQNIALYIKNLRAEEEGVGNEIKKLQTRKKSLANKSEGLVNYLTYFLPENFKHNFTNVCINWRKSKRLKLDDRFVLPECYQRVTIEPDKIKIKDDIEAGATIIGAEIEEVLNLQIK